jgi:hypothetical protein
MGHRHSTIESGERDGLKRAFSGMKKQVSRNPVSIKQYNTQNTNARVTKLSYRRNDSIESFDSSVSRGFNVSRQMTHQIVTISEPQSLKEESLTKAKPTKLVRKVKAVTKRPHSSKKNV